MIIIDQGSSVDLNQERDDEESDEGQYQDQEESTGRHWKEGNDNDDKETDITTEEEIDDDMGNLDDKDYEGFIFAQKVVLCNIQEKAGSPPS